MLPSRLIRWSGLAGLLGGLLFAIPIVFHPLEQNALGFLAPLYVPVHVLLILSTILTLFSLIGLYARQADTTGSLGLIGFILAFIGTVLVEGLLSFEGLVVPVLAKLDPALVAGLTAPVYTGPVLGYIIGSSVFLRWVTSSSASPRSAQAYCRAGQACWPRWGRSVWRASAAHRRLPSPSAACYSVWAWRGWGMDSGQARAQSAPKLDLLTRRGAVSAGQVFSIQ